LTLQRYSVGRTLEPTAGLARVGHGRHPARSSIWQCRDRRTAPSGVSNVVPFSQHLTKSGCLDC